MGRPSHRQAIEVRAGHELATRIAREGCPGMVLPPGTVLPPATVLPPGVLLSAGALLSPAPWASAVRRFFTPSANSLIS